MDQTGAPRSPQHADNGRAEDGCAEEQGRGVGSAGVGAAAPVVADVASQGTPGSVHVLYFTL